MKNKKDRKGKMLVEEVVPEMDFEYELEDSDTSDNSEDEDYEKEKEELNEMKDEKSLEIIVNLDDFEDMVNITCNTLVHPDETCMGNYSPTLNLDSGKITTLWIKSEISRKEWLVWRILSLLLLQKSSLILLCLLFVG